LVYLLSVIAVASFLGNLYRDYESLFLVAGLFIG
jgi:hypothetical protein